MTNFVDCLFPFYETYFEVAGVKKKVNSKVNSKEESHEKENAPSPPPQKKNNEQNVCWYLFHVTHK